VLSLDLERGIATIDLARIGFVNAYALTALACFIASTAGDGLAVVLILPEEIDVRSWLSRMHLGDVLDTFEVRVEGVLPRVAERDRKDTLIELERFEDSRGSDRLASFIWERLEGGADGEVVNQLFEATGELGLNVVEHAGGTCPTARRSGGRSNGTSPASRTRAGDRGFLGSSKGSGGSAAPCGSGAGRCRGP
jgi:hypothetical protein